MAHYWTRCFLRACAVISVIGCLHVVEAQCPEDCESTCKEHDRWCASNNTAKYHISSGDLGGQNIAAVGCIEDGFGDGGTPGLNLQVWRTVWDDCAEDCDTADLTTGDKTGTAIKTSQGSVTVKSECGGT